MSRDVRLYLIDMRDACARIVHHRSGIPPAVFFADAVVRDAVLWNLLVLGEAAKQVPEEVRAAYPLRIQAPLLQDMTLHHLRWLITLTLFLTAVQGAAVENRRIPGIKGDDDRVLVEARNYPWGAIGRLNNTLGPFCTGTLIGPRQVLTAAHCLWNKRTRNWLPACALHFLAGYQRSGYLAHSLVVSYRLAAGEPIKGTEPPGLTGDWAVLTLAEDLSTAAEAIPTAPLDPKLLESYRQQGGEFVQAGYSRDRPHILTLHDNCHLERFSAGGRLVLHQCDATFGDSGSPILLRSDGKYHVVAMHIATDNRRARGIALTGSVFHDSLQTLEPAPPMDRAFKACQVPAGGYETAKR